MCVIARVDRDSVTVVALASPDELGGGIAFVAPGTDSILGVYLYPASRGLTVVGNRRLLFTQTAVGTPLGGDLESNYVMLCAMSRNTWLHCLELPRDHFHIAGADSWLREHNVATVRGDSLIYERSVVFQSVGARDSTVQHLDTVVIRLPRLP
jgi:hypothetical protein